MAKRWHLFTRARFSSKILWHRLVSPRNQLALSLRIPANRITAIIAGKRGITADTAFALPAISARAPKFWMGLQADYDLQTERDKNGQEIEREVLIPA